MRYRLRTLLILLATLPPLLGLGWVKYTAWRAEQARREQVALQKWLDENLQNAWAIERQWIYEQTKDDPP